MFLRLKIHVFTFERYTFRYMTNLYTRNKVSIPSFANVSNFGGEKKEVLGVSVTMCQNLLWDEIGKCSVEIQQSAVIGH